MSNVPFWFNMMKMQSVEINEHFIDQILLLQEGKHHNPHAILGLHNHIGGNKVIRLWRRNPIQIFLEVNGSIVEAVRIHHAGLFEYVVRVSAGPLDYRIFHQNGLFAHDPYAFEPTFGEIDQYLFAKGVHYRLYQRMGGRVDNPSGSCRCKIFRLGANAKSVSLLGISTIGMAGSIRCGC